MSKRKQLTKTELLDAIIDKIVVGVQLSFRKFLREAIRDNRKLVIMRDNKVVLIPANELKGSLRKKITSNRSKSK